MRVNPRKMNTDPCEKHFGNTRQCVGGSRSGLNTEQFQISDARAGMAERANFAAIGNNRCSEDHFKQGRNKY